MKECRSTRAVSLWKRQAFLLNCNESPRATSLPGSDPSSGAGIGKLPPSPWACPAGVPPARPDCSRRWARCCRDAAASSGRRWRTRPPVAGEACCCAETDAPAPADRWTCPVESPAGDCGAGTTVRAVAAPRTRPARYARCDFCTSRVSVDSARPRTRLLAAVGCGCRSAAGYAICRVCWTIRRALPRCCWTGDLWKNFESRDECEIGRERTETIVPEKSRTDQTLLKIKYERHYHHNKCLLHPNEKIYHVATYQRFTLL